LGVALTPQFGAAKKGNATLNEENAADKKSSVALRKGVNRKAAS
jgi:hypothetical protein